MVSILFKIRETAEAFLLPKVGIWTCLICRQTSFRVGMPRDLSHLVLPANRVSDTTDDNATDAICPTHVHVRGAVRVDIPLPPKLEDMPDRLSERQAVRRFLATSPEFRALVDTGCWNSSGSFAYEQANYFSAAEHTAQLDKTDRKNHEANFEDGSINVLASSTTMEMGIDLATSGQFF